MGLEMDLYCDGEHIAEINWLRNPFGLIRWVKDNTRDENTKYTLDNVCNYWAYDRGASIEKDEFLKTVMAYQKQVEELEEGYFFFNLSEYRIFVQPNLDKMKVTKDVLGCDKIDGERYAPDGRLMVPMSQFQNVRAYSNTTLEDHKRWYKKLVDFAMLLQKPGVHFYCSN